SLLPGSARACGGLPGRWLAGALGGSAGAGQHHAAAADLRGGQRDRAARCAWPRRPARNRGPGPADGAAACRAWLGSSARRADWLPPVLSACAQSVYLAALGLARQVPGPIVFALCALTTTWYASLRAPSPAPASRSGDARPMGGLGWESRMFIVTFTAIVGIV